MVPNSKGVKKVPGAAVRADRVAPGLTRASPPRRLGAALFPRVSDFQLQGIIAYTKGLATLSPVTVKVAGNDPEIVRSPRRRYFGHLEQTNGHDLRCGFRAADQHAPALEGSPGLKRVVGCNPR